MIEGTAMRAGRRRDTAARVGRGLLAIAALVLSLIAMPACADDPRVDALAASLHHSPAEIFAYQRDENGIDLYSGSLRGPRGTIASKAGNPLDRAALAVALLRASGFTAHFAQGTLAASDATRVVASTFPPVVRALGCYNPGGVYDVVNDYALNTLARSHTWVEYKPTPASAWVAFDPTFADATLGTANATPSTTFDDIPDAQMQKVRFHVTAEIYTQAGALYGFPIGTETVLDQTFNAADLVDKPVTIGHFTSQTTLPTPTITASTNTYSPYLVVGDSAVDPRDYAVIRGTDYSETLTNFPLGSSVLTGVFVDIDVIDPANPGSPQTTRRTLVDRIGYANRATGGVVAYTPSPDNGPALTPLDLLTIQVAPSKQPVDDFAARHDRMVSLQAEAASIAPAVAALPAPGAMSPDDVALATRAVALNRAMSIAAMELATASLEGGAGVAMDRLGALSLVGT
jgi:transglutaminase-like putative cysteine protease